MIEQPKTWGRDDDKAGGCLFVFSGVALFIGAALAVAGLVVRTAEPLAWFGATVTAWFLGGACGYRAGQKRR